MAASTGERIAAASAATTPGVRQPSATIDGNVSGNYSDGGQTHTQENTSSPWWEVDLGAEYPIDSIVIYNRTEDNLGKRLSQPA